MLTPHLRYFPDCPILMHHCNAHFSRDVTTVMWNESGRENPAWVFTDGGKEIHQLNNSKPSLAFGHEVFGEVEYDGTFYVDDNKDNDWIGYIFSYQDKSNFYLFSASLWNITDAQGTWSVQRINDSVQEDPLHSLQPHTEGGGKILWQYQPNDTPPNKNGRLIFCLVTFNSNRHISGGWEFKTSYRFNVHHQPMKNKIR